MKLLVLMWLLLQPSSTLLNEKSLAYSMNIPTFGRDHPFIHQVKLNGFRPMFMKHLSKLVVPNLSILWMDILSLSSSRMVWPMPSPLEDPQIWTWTHIHMSFTSPDELDPSQVPDQLFGDPMFDACGDFNKNIIANLNTLLDAPPGDCGSYTDISSVFTANLHQSSPQEPDWNTQRPFLAWTSPSSIKDTFNVTARHGTAPHTQDYIKKHFKSRNPVFSIPRCCEETPSSLTLLLLMMVQPWPNSSVVMILLSVMHMASNQPYNSSTPSLITSVKRGAMDTLISDGGKYEISKGVTDLLHSLFIQDYQSQPYHQDQNKDENCFGPAKPYTNTVMNTSGCRACCWLLCLQYICVVLHHLASPTLQGICPAPALQGTTPDISFMLHSSFSEPVHYRIDSSEPDFHFPSPSNEKKGYWVVLPATQVTVSPGGSSLRILKRSSFVLAFKIPSELQQTSILHHLQRRGPHFLFQSLIHNNLKILSHLIPLMNQHPLLSILSTVSLVKMKIIQST